MLDKKELSRLARLAGLTLKEEETGRITRDLGRMLEYVGQLNEVDTENVEPTGGVAAEPGRFRADLVAPSMTVEDALSGAPDRAGDFFRVPAVITARRRKES